MSSSSIKLLLLTALITFTISGDSPGLVVFENIQLEKSHIQREMTAILDTWFKGNDYTKENWSYIDAGRLWNGYLKLTNFIQVNTFDPVAIDLFEVSNGVFYSLNDTINIKLAMDYEAKTGTWSSFKGKAFLNVIN
jgi:hypothetical protein